MRLKGGALVTKAEREAEVMKRIEWSAGYVKKAEPIIRDLLRGGHILRVEGKTEEVCRALDIVCGTDYVYIYPERHHAWGVACRVQKYDYANFTVRKATESGAVTELDKRRYAIRHRGIYPHLTMQMFVDDEAKTIRRIGIARTEDIIDAIEKGIAKDGKVTKDSIGKNQFLYIDWKDMKAAGYIVQTYESPGARKIA